MFGNTSELAIGILKEATWGVLPSPAAFQLMRVTGESLDAKRENVVSQEIRPDRNVADLIQVGGGASGGMNIELSYSTFDQLLEAAFFSAFNSNVMVNGVTPSSFHVKKKVELGATDVYFLFKGMMVNGFTLSCKTKSIVTGSFDLIGKECTVGTTTTGSDTSATTKAVMNAASDFVLTTGIISPAPRLLSVNLKIDNGLREQAELGSVALAGVGTGQCKVTGSFEAYFQSKTLVDAFLAGTAGGLKFTIGSTTAEKYTFNIPSLKLVTQKINAGGNDQDLIISCDFQGLYNSGIAGTIQLAKAVA